MTTPDPLADFEPWQRDLLRRLQTRYIHDGPVPPWFTAGFPLLADKLSHHPLDGIGNEVSRLLSLIPEPQQRSTHEQGIAADPLTPHPYENSLGLSDAPGPCVHCGNRISHQLHRGSFARLEGGELATGIIPNITNDGQPFVIPQEPTMRPFNPAAFLVGTTIKHHDGDDAWNIESFSVQHDHERDEVIVTTVYRRIPNDGV